MIRTRIAVACSGGIADDSNAEVNAITAIKIYFGALLIAHLCQEVSQPTAVQLEVPG
jgi:hypothetical protein